MTYALVTGASKGIGKAIAANLAAKGHNLLLVAGTESLLAEVAAQLRALHPVDVRYLAIDLSQVNAAQFVFDWCTHQQLQVNILVNNAGYGQGGPFAASDFKENRSMMQLNMVTLVEMCAMFMPMLRAAGAEQAKPSYILNISSTAAYQAVPGLNLYAATKVFVLSFSRGLMQELKGSNVHVTCISPGTVDTNFANRARLGPRALKAAQKLNMTPQYVASTAVAAMFNGKAEVVVGWMNKVGALAAWLLPKSLVEKVAGSIYKE